MSKQVINRSTPNDNAGDTPYVGAGKINDNFTELYERQGIVELDFSSTPTNEGSVTITGLTNFVLATSTPQAWISERSTTNNTITDHRFASIALRLICTDFVDGVGFTIRAYCIIGSVTGKFKIDYSYQ